MTGELLADGTKKICLARAQFDELSVIMRAFYQKTKCGAVLLSDTSGLLINHVGTFDGNSVALLSSLAAGNYAATNEMARLVGEVEGFKVHFLEGKKNSIYVTGIDESFFLVIVFGEHVTFGMIRVLVSKMIEQMQRVLSMPVQGETVEIAKKEVESKEFREELSSRLDAILFQKS